MSLGHIASRTGVAGLLLVLMNVFALAAFAQSTPPAPSASVAGLDETEEAATVRYFNRDIYTLRAPYRGRSARERAIGAEQNIARAVAEAGEAGVGFERIPQGLIVLVNGGLAFAVLHDDLDALKHETMEQAQAEIANRVGEAVQAAEVAMRPQHLLRGIGLAVLATLIALALGWALGRSGRWLRARFDIVIQRRLETLRSTHSRHLLDGLIAGGRNLTFFLYWVVVAILVEEWLRFVLDQFAFTRPWSRAMTSWLLALVKRFSEAIVGALPGLLAAVLIFLIARVIAQTTSLLFRGVQDGRFRLFGIDKQTAEPTRKMLVVIVWLFALAMAYPYLPGSHTAAFQGVSVLFGLMISLGASSIVAQAAGGFTLLYSRAIQPGEFVRIGEHEGVVQQIGLFTTRLRTVLGVEVSLPNAVVLSTQIQNFSRPGMWITTALTIGYDSPWRQVHALLLEAAANTPGLQKQPEPFVRQKALSDFHVEYELGAHIAEPLHRGRVLSELHARIQDAFNAAGVQIMSPSYEADPETPKIVPPPYWNGRPAESARESGGHRPERK